LHPEESELEAARTDREFFWNSLTEGIHFQEPAMSATNQGIVPQNVQKSGAPFYGSGALTSTITHSNSYRLN